MNKLSILLLVAILSSCAGTIEGLRADWNMALEDAKPVIDEIGNAIKNLESINDNVGKE